MSQGSNQSQNKGGGFRKVLVGLLAVVVVAAVLMFLFYGGASGLSTFTARIADVADDISVSAGQVADDVNVFDNDMINVDDFILNEHQLILRPDDLSIRYDLSGDSRLSNEEIAGRQSTLGKIYVTQTGRIDGWQLTMTRYSSNTIGPVEYTSRVEIFEDAEGASDAISEEYFFAYTDKDQRPDEFVDTNCGVGTECIIFMYRDVTPGAGISSVRYDIAYRYKNVLVWVSTNGSEADTNERFVTNAGEIILEKIQDIE